MTFQEDLLSNLLYQNKVYAGNSSCDKYIKTVRVNSLVCPRRPRNARANAEDLRLRLLFPILERAATWRLKQ